MFKTSLELNSNLKNGASNQANNSNIKKKLTFNLVNQISDDESDEEKSKYYKRENINNERDAKEEDPAFKKFDQKLVEIQEK